jgi:hypothetical protein
MIATIIFVFVSAIIFSQLKKAIGSHWLKTTPNAFFPFHAQSRKRGAF